MILNDLVGERGFEPPTPGPRTMKLQHSKCFIWCRLGSSGYPYSLSSVVPKCTEEDDARLNRQTQSNLAMLDQAELCSPACVHLSLPLNLKGASLQTSEDRWAGLLVVYSHMMQSPTDEPLPP